MPEPYEYDGSGAVLRRHVHGGGADEPVLTWESSGTGDPRWLHADERGSIVAGTNAGGGVALVNGYGPYGEPGKTQTGRFGYTGQMWLSGPGLYHYKARAYAPALGRFLQTDPIGTADNTNLYAYVRNDPVNRTDPSGLFDTDIVVNGALNSALNGVILNLAQSTVNFAATTFTTPIPSGDLATLADMGGRRQQIPTSSFHRMMAAAISL